MMAPRLCARFPWEILTPFGSPVDPDVYCRNASADRSDPPPPPSSSAAPPAPAPSPASSATAATELAADGDGAFAVGSGLSVTTHWSSSGQRESSPVSLALKADACVERERGGGYFVVERRYESRGVHGGCGNGTGGPENR